VVTIASEPAGSQSSADAEVDPEEDQGPEEDGEEGGEDELDQADADVVIGEGHVDPDQDVDEAKEAESAANHGVRLLYYPPPEDWRVVCAGEVPLGKPAKSGGDQAADLVAAGDHRGVAPEAFEVVVGPLLLEEHVDHEVDEVQEDPTGVALSLAAQGAGTLGAAGALDLFGDGANLAVAVARADDEVVGDDQRLRDVEDQDVAGLLGGCRRCGGEREVEAGRQGRAPEVGAVGPLYRRRGGGEFAPGNIYWFP
jgi:hypothetical protein